MKKLKKILDKKETLVKLPRKVTLKEKPVVETAESFVEETYESKQCAYVNADGVQCKAFATGNGSLCAVHTDRVNQTTKLAAPYEKHPVERIRKTSFDPVFHPLEFIKLSRLGYSDVEIAAEFGISKATLKRWANDFLEFQEAYDIGLTMYEAFFLKKGTDNLENDRFNNTMFKYLAGNKLGYTDKIETKNTNTGGFGVLLVPGQVSLEEWERANIESQKKLPE